MKKFLFLGLLFASSAYAQTVGIHVGSYHTSPGFNNFNPGVYGIWDNGFTAGAYYNSERRLSLYGGYTWQGEYLALTAGLVTGYKLAPVLPMLAPSVRVPVSETAALRLSYVPKIAKNGAHALHFSVEVKF